MLDAADNLTSENDRVFLSIDHQRANRRQTGACIRMQLRQMLTLPWARARGRVRPVVRLDPHRAVEKLAQHHHLRVVVQRQRRAGREAEHADREIVALVDVHVGDPGERPRREKPPPRRAPLVVVLRGRRPLAAAAAAFDPDVRRLHAIEQVLQPPDLLERRQPCFTPRREDGVARVVQPLHLALVVVHGHALAVLPQEAK